MNEWMSSVQEVTAIKFSICSNIVTSAMDIIATWKEERGKLLSEERGTDVEITAEIATIGSETFLRAKNKHLYITSLNLDR